MIQLTNLTLPPDTDRRLKMLQGRIDRINRYEARVAEAKRLFGQHNRPGDPIFRWVRATLTRMCTGARRCGYCEDSYADEVEHIKPKDLYPEVVFVWSNYLYACGPCNGPKNSHFADFAVATGDLTEIGRKPHDPIIEPEDGDPVMIDPRQEDPSLLMTLDLRDTFFFVPSAARGSRDFERAEYTIRILRLNSRDLLPAAREEAYCSYRARLVEYIAHRQQGASDDQLQALIGALQRMGHPSVWREMQRQHQLIPELRVLFTQAPEALRW